MIHYSGTVNDKSEDMRMKKRSFPLYSMIALAVSFVPAAFLWIADIMSDRSTYFYFGESFFTGGLFFFCV